MAVSEKKKKKLSLLTLIMLSLKLFNKQKVRGLLKESLYSVIL